MTSTRPRRPPDRRLPAAGPCLLALALASLPAAVAAECRGYAIANGTGPFALAKVSHGPRTAFRQDTPPCPDESPACRQRAYVVPDDTVIVGNRLGDYTCAFHPGRRRDRSDDTTGYVRTDELAFEPAPGIPSLAAWAGTWADGDDTLTLKPDAGTLSVSGDAFWPYADPPRSVAPYGPQLGSVKGRAAPTDRTLVLHDTLNDDCVVRATLLPPFLVVDDNGECGGANVSFQGVYRRR